MMGIIEIGVISLLPLEEALKVFNPDFISQLVNAKIKMNIIINLTPCNIKSRLGDQK